MTRGIGDDRTLYVVPKIPGLPPIPESERTPLVVALLEVIHLQQEQLQALKDEIARLKGQKPKPKIKPSKLEPGSSKPQGEDRPGGKRPGSTKRSKTRELEIHKTEVVRPDYVPEGSRFKGYEDYTVQDLIIGSFNTRFRVQRWVGPGGEPIVGELPAWATEGHFGPTLVSFMLYQYYHAHVTQPLILEQLLEFGVDISAGEVNRIIVEGKERFHAEKDEILRVGLEVSDYIHTDDTGARHQGKNGYCTHIGNEFFAWFASTESKSRINFLELLRAGHSDYVLNDAALEYMRTHKLPKAQLEILAAQEGQVFADRARWVEGLAAMGITKGRHVRIATEGALLGSALTHGLDPGMAIMSDDAGQFDILLHILCWVHAERTLAKLVGFSDEQRDALEAKRTEIWDLYTDLKAYKEAPDAEAKAELTSRFDAIFTEKTCFSSLNHALKRIHDQKSQLLLVLDRPELPLHNNLSESDIREYVKKRKISGSTRSDEGRRCRDTFTSLKKTSRKLGVSFWKYLTDRVAGVNTVPRLGDLICQRAHAPPVMHPA